jgi:hypothetical protein
VLFLATEILIGFFAFRKEIWNRVSSTTLLYLKGSEKGGRPKKIYFDTSMFSLEYNVANRSTEHQNDDNGTSAITHTTLFSSPGFMHINLTRYYPPLPVGVRLCRRYQP